MITLNQIHDNNNNNNKIYSKYFKKAEHFYINHYAGKVLYDARGFMNKNREN